MQELGAWDGDRAPRRRPCPARSTPTARRPATARAGDLEAADRRRPDARRRATYLKATARTPVALVSAGDAGRARPGRRRARSRSRPTRGSVDAAGRGRRPARRGGVGADDLARGRRAPGSATSGWRADRTEHRRMSTLSTLRQRWLGHRRSPRLRQRRRGGSILVKAVLIFVFLVVLTLFNIWFERRVVARMQHRIGPNVHGPFGLLQRLADGIKLALKEDIIPTAADKVGLHPGAGAVHGAGVPGVRGDPVRARGDDPVHRHHDAAAAHRHAGRACSSSWRSARSASTASCSAAGRAGRRTRCSAACAARRR